MRFLSAAKSVALASIAALTRRHAVLLPRESSSEDLELGIRTAYRVDLPRNQVTILESSPGKLDLTLLGYEGSFPRRILWSLRGVEYPGPSDLILNIETGFITFGDGEVGRVPVPLPGRRFAWRLTHHRAGGKELTRLTSHYTPGAGAVVSKAYYHGDDYVDYDAQAAGEADQILSLLREHGAGKRLLEIGSATGLVLDRLIREGFDAVGIDFSEWAVDHARETIGDGKVFLVDVEHEPVPESVATRAPFDTLLLWAVLEHFHEPFAVLEKLAPLAAPGSLLVINTTNFSSLSRKIFGRDWEGYFDWTHHGVDSLDVETMRARLPHLGWQIETLYTHLFWDSGADPEHAVLRETYANDARLRRLLASRNLGDLMVCVARRSHEMAY